MISKRYNLSASELFTAILREANLKNVGLNHTDLAGADLSGASLNMANLTDANLAVVKNANIQWSYYVHHYLARCATYS